jgi:protein-tyrosine-phosphatase
MAEAFAKSLGGWEVWSAGSHPGGRVHPVAVELMRELPLSLEGQYSKGVNQVPAREWDMVVTMGCGDACPTVRATRRLDWAIPDPVAVPLEEARRIRDELLRRVRVLHHEMVDKPRAPGQDKASHP